MGNCHSDTFGIFLNKLLVSPTYLLTYSGCKVGKPPALALALRNGEKDGDISISIKYPNIVTEDLICTISLTGGKNTTTLNEGTTRIIFVDKGFQFISNDIEKLKHSQFLVEDKYVITKIRDFEYQMYFHRNENYDE